jgi:ABC-type hemin transport system substrate-binding protein
VVRIVSLVPSLTELVCALGLGDRLVGRTGYCVHPSAALRAVPKIGGTKSVNVAKIKALKATHLIVNKDENERDTVDMLRPFVGEVIETHPIRVEDNLALFGELAARLGSPLALAQALQAQLQKACCI